MRVLPVFFFILCIAGGILFFNRVQAHNAGAPNVTTIHYRWRDDSVGLNTNSGWLATEDSIYASGITLTEYRIRFELSNEGTDISRNVDYALQYAERTGATCGDETFATIGTTAGAGVGLYMTTSAQYTDADATTAGYLTAESTTFVNGVGVESTSVSTGNVTLDIDQYTEVEFVVASQTATTKTFCLQLSNADTTSVYGEITITPAVSDLTWVTSMVDGTGFDIYQSGTLTWDAGTQICGATLTDDNASTVSCSSSSVAASTQYRVQVALGNAGNAQSIFYNANGTVDHVNVQGGWAGTSPTLGSCAFADLDTDNLGTPVCSVSYNGNNVRITNTGTVANAVVIGTASGAEGFMYLITTDTDAPSTNSTSYMDATDASADTENSSKITITGPTASGNFNATASSSQSFNSTAAYSFTRQTTTMSNIGAISVEDDRGSSPGWTLNATSNDWKFGDATAAMDYDGNGSDDNTGKMCLFPAGGTLYAQTGSLTGVSKGSNACFGPSTTQIEVLSATNGNGNGFYWLTDSSLEQLLPGFQTPASYTTTIIFTLS